LLVRELHHRVRNNLAVQRPARPATSKALPTRSWPASPHWRKSMPS
jgi:hypothetical protein